MRPDAPVRPVISGGPGRFPGLNRQPAAPPPVGSGGDPATFTLPSLKLPDLGVTKRSATLAARNGLIVVVGLYVLGIIAAAIGLSAFSSYFGSHGVGSWLRVGGYLAGASLGGHVGISRVYSGSTLFGAYGSIGVGWQA
ncbi:MAG: hypothetical protein ACRDWV_11425, partial [Acidimicrobiales bacterium]